jgi:hypothetical protein
MTTSCVYVALQVGSGIPPALAAARRLVRSELQTPPELVQVRKLTKYSTASDTVRHSTVHCRAVQYGAAPCRTGRCCACGMCTQGHPLFQNQWGCGSTVRVCTPALLSLQELSRVAAAAGLPGAGSWVQPNSSTWPAVWAAITKVCGNELDLCETACAMEYICACQELVLLPHIPA